MGYCQITSCIPRLKSTFLEKISHSSFGATPLEKFSKSIDFTLWGKCCIFPSNYNSPQFKFTAPVHCACQNTYGFVHGEGFLISSMRPAMFFKKRLCIFFSSISRNFIVGRWGTAAAGAAILWGTDEVGGWPQNMLCGAGRIRNSYFLWSFCLSIIVFISLILSFFFMILVWH